MRDEEISLPNLIESISRQTFAPAEIILVDGGSSDQTVLVAKQLASGDARFRIIETEQATPGKGRNIGIAAAKYEWIALTDAGIVLEPTWLQELVAIVQEYPSASVVYGNYEPITNTFFQRCAALAFTAPKTQRANGLMRGPSIASSLLRRDVWEVAGSFPDLRAAEDLIFMEKVEKHGFEIGWAPEATVWWQIQPTLRATFRKFVLYSRHNVWAGRQWDWHYGIVRNYLLGLPFFILALTYNLWWISLPISGALARVSKTIWVRRENRGLFWLLNPMQFVQVGIILAAIDIATFVGWGQALLQRRKSDIPSSTIHSQSTR